MFIYLAHSSREITILIIQIAILSSGFCGQLFSKLGLGAVRWDSSQSNQKLFFNTFSKKSLLFSIIPKFYWQFAVSYFELLPRDLQPNRSMPVLK